MNRPVLRCWKYFSYDILLVPAIIVLALFPPTGYPVEAAVLAVISVSLSWRSRWRWRLARHVRRFRMRNSDHVLLYYAPEFGDLWDSEMILKQCQDELEWVAKRVDAKVRGRPAVYLFASHEDIARIFGQHYGGTALSEANAIFVAVDNFLRESLRHEFGHLFSLRWCPLAPPLISEGLSVWLQETFRGEPIDMMAWPWLSEPDLDLRRLMSQSRFFAEPNRDQCYVLAGSFTGFLVRKFGWETFRKLFRVYNGVGFTAKFKRCFGVSLETADRQWRNEVRSMGPLGRPL